MDLNTVWFMLVTILFIGFFFLEGFDYGVGILMPFLGKDDTDRRVIINTIGPHWDGNEVWLITAGGAIFAAFPNWYATLFSGFYLALFLMLLALIVRAVAFEFRSKDRRPAWRKWWDWMIFVGSLVPALLWGVAIANLIRGVPIDANMNYVGNFGDLLFRSKFGFTSYLNSIVIAVGATLISTLSAMLAGFGFSRFRFPLRNQILVMILLIQMVPLLAVIIPLYRLYSLYGLYDTRIGLMIVYAVRTVSMNTWLLKGYFDTIPVEIEEAALIDGCSRLQALRWTGRARSMPNSSGWAPSLC